MSKNEIKITLTAKQRGDLWDNSGENPAGDWRDVLTTRDEAEMQLFFDSKRIPRTATVNLHGDASKDIEPVHVYSCRAQCAQDALMFIGALYAQNIKLVHLIVIPDERYPDVELEFGALNSINVELVSILQQQLQGHMMLETLRFCSLSENTFQRQYSPHPLLREQN